MFIDEAKVYAQGGKGGPGCLSFRRRKYEPKGGPDGGNGGRGGDVILEASKSVKTLYELKNNPHLRAESGQPGGTNDKFGKSGNDIKVYVPVGTTVYDKNKNILADLVEEGQKFVAAKGGRGGRGNKAFLSNSNREPRIRELGEPGADKTLFLEIRLIADVGLLGVPNAGKSTLLSVLSNAKPKIASYPFTTVEPQLGAIVNEKGYSFVIADFPGLIEGASEGVGLGDQFLKHLKRNRILLHLIDMAGVDGRKPWDDYKKIKEEISKYDIDLQSKVELVVGNKFDLPVAEENFNKFVEKTGVEPIKISAVAHKNISKLKKTIMQKINEKPKPKFESKVDKHKVHKDKRHFTIKKIGEEFHVDGVYLKKLLDMTDFSLDESLKRTTDIMKKIGVFKSLKKHGAADGDKVVVAEEYNFTYYQD